MIGRWWEEEKGKDFVKSYLVSFLPSLHSPPLTEASPLLCANIASLASALVTLYMENERG